MLDPTISLSFALHSSKGVYGLLLGSGVSRAAQIPTGQEVMLDLIRKIAGLEDEDCEPDPIAWYEVKYGEAANYDSLLARVARTPADRQQLLRAYFEPTNEERTEGIKSSTVAHKAIARLIKGGYIRVVVTTNFDHLLEMALEELGIRPTVISTTDAIKGARPLAHSNCTIIKVHGDYLDSRIRNTPAELERYPSELNRLLDQVFDEYGLVICGWSADWDVALRAALERCKSHRFTTFWATRGNLSETAQRLANLRQAEVIQIKDADNFFETIAEKVSALEELNRPHPLSTKLAVANLKQYLVEVRHRIRLHDLIMDEANKLYQELDDKYFPPNIELKTNSMVELKPEILRRVQRYEALVEPLQALILNGCYYGEDGQAELWMRCLERIVNRPINPSPSFLPDLRSLRFYPSLILLYSGGMAALAAKRYYNFATLTTKVRIKEEYQPQTKPLALGLSTRIVMHKEVAYLLPGQDQHHTPLSDHLYEILREPFREFLPQEEEYQKCFDRFEYLLALVVADLYEKQEKEFRTNLGAFGWRKDIIREVEAEAKAQGSQWPPLLVNLFDGSLQRFLNTKAGVDAQLQRASWW